MKKNTLIYMMLMLVLAASCVKERVSVPFSVSTEAIEVLSEGGSFSLDLQSQDYWTASSDNPWITVSPANGPASATCSISVDSTVVSTPRTGIVRFKNSVTGENRDIHVSQDGYGYNISLAENEVTLKNFAFLDDRTFEVKVRTNVPFTVVIPSTAKNWLSCEDPEFHLDRGARPREVTLKFKWGVNSIPLSREAKVTFIPFDGWKVDSTEDLSILQVAAPEIKIGHEGDSIAILSLARSLNLWQELETAGAMKDWDNVTLWEETDEGYTPEKAGRVKTAYFQLMQTEESIPYEVQYLTEVEELVFFSNVNSFIKNLDLGEHICKLTKLKRLAVSAYGLITLPDEMKNLKNLEYLDISANNFGQFPAVLTPENFPNLRHLYLNTNQRSYILDLSNTLMKDKDLGGLKGPFPRRLLEWENLETLRLSVNYFEGEMPDMLDYPVKYTEQDCKDLNLPLALVGTPKVLPNATFFAFNLNRMYGDLPDWVLYHPHLVDWEPYTLCYPQEGRASNGRAAFFSNVPVNMDYYWKFYEGYKEHVDIYIGG